jgi:hypothetical protein
MSVCSHSLRRRTRLSVSIAACLAILVVWLVLGYVSSASAAVCANEALRIGPSAALPDCRAYEMVSPPDKNGGEVDGGVHKGAMLPPEQAAADGEAVTYASTSAFVETAPQSALVSSQYLSTRTPNGWQTREIVPVQQVPQGKVALLGEGVPAFSPFQGFSEDLASGFLLAWDPQPDPSAPAKYFNPYLLDAAAGTYGLLSGVLPPTQPPGEVDLSGYGFGVVYGGMSADGSHVIFEANDALTPEAIPGRVNLYEWSAGKPLELVSELPDGTVDPSGAATPLGNSISMSFGAQSGFLIPNFDGALSRNGRRAFWNGGVATNDQLYMHEVTPSGARTIEVSASQNPHVSSGSAPAVFRAANAEGSRVFFSSRAKLTEDSTASSGGEDLYEYDVDADALTDITVDGNTGESADVQGTLGVGEASGAPYVYFVAEGVLARGASTGQNNLYVWRGAGAPTFIATLGRFEGERLDFEHAVTSRTARVSPGGQFLAFQSTQPLTGYDNVPAGGTSCPEPVRGGSEFPYHEPPEGRCMEVFEYDVQSGQLACVSCQVNGLPPSGDSLVPEVPHLLENVRGWQSPTVQQRYLLDDGRLFFTSEDPVLPAATNGHQNVYEYEPEGVGQCAVSGAGGCQYLISTGQAGGDSYFADAGEDGRDVFLLTNEQLGAQDGDGATDLYDAREDGGFPVAVSPPCAGEACKPALTPAPAIYGSPASASFQGAGNLRATPPAGANAKQKHASKKHARKPTRRARRKTTHSKKVTDRRSRRNPGRRLHGTGRSA